MRQPPAAVTCDLSGRSHQGSANCLRDFPPRGLARGGQGGPGRGTGPRECVSEGSDSVA